jgi:antitoxin component of MazEF toxin-antitoxin module
MKRIKLENWDGSLALRIPEPVANAMSFHRGTLVDIVKEDGCLVIKRHLPHRKYRLSDLLSQCNGPNPSRELIRGRVGNEAI